MYLVQNKKKACGSYSSFLQHIKNINTLFSQAIKQMLFDKSTEKQLPQNP